MTMIWKQLLSPQRLGKSEAEAISPERSPFQQDFDRIVFSGAFRRLQDKTQVFPLVRADYVRTRLTHSIETSSIARSLGTAAGGFICRSFDTGGAHPSDVGAVVAAAALAHDIGNPPLGHAGEEAIRHWFTTSATGRRMEKELSTEVSGDFANYVGTAQGFRVLTRLEMPDRRGGMQLCCATLGAFTKYPSTSTAGQRAPGVAGKKFGIFHSERELFSEVAERCGLIAVSESSWCRHPLAWLVEAADDIAYLTVDFEDGQRLGLIDYAEIERLFLQLIDSARSREYLRRLDSPTRKTEFMRAKVIGRLIEEVSEVFRNRHDEIIRGTLQKPLIEYTDCRDVLAEIRTRSVSGIYNHRRVAEVIGAGFEMVSGMLDIFVPCVNELAAERSGGPAASYRSRRIGAILPESVLADTPEWRSDPGLRLMRVLDYISGMTDGYAVSLFQKLKGISL